LLWLLLLGTCFWLFTKTEAATKIRANQINLTDVFAFTGANTHAALETFPAGINAGASGQNTLANTIASIPGGSQIGFPSAPFCCVQIGNGVNQGVALETTATVNRITFLPDTSGTLLETGNGTTPIQTKRIGGCTTGAAQFNTCDTTVTWTTAFADANYTATCTGDAAGGGVPQIEGISISAAKVGASITVRTIALTAVAASFTTIDCTALHD